MKTLTKENVTEAVQEVIDQGRILKDSYISSDGKYRDVVGYLLENKELHAILTNNANGLPIGVIGKHLIGTEPEGILSALQFINDTATSMDNFKARCTQIIEESY